MHVEEPLREGGVLSAARGNTAIPEPWARQNEAKSGWKVIRTWRQVSESLIQSQQWVRYRSLQPACGPGAGVDAVQPWARMVRMSPVLAAQSSSSDPEGDAASPDS